MTKPSFTEQIQSTMSAERVSDTVSRLEHMSGSRLVVREQGCFATELTLTHKDSDSEATSVSVLYSDPDLTLPKLVASHIMSPAGPSEDIGGQHGFARWSKYHVFEQPETPQSDQQIAFQAERSDMGIGASKLFTLYDDTLTMSTTLINSESGDVRTSVGEHLYFRYDNGPDGRIRVNNQTLDELLGDGTEASVMNGEAVYWPGYNGMAILNFPAGYTVGLDARLTDADNSQLGMLIWRNPETDSICLEPTAGFRAANDNHNLIIPAYGSVTLTTSIELLYAEESKPN